jgi:peptide deformylase
MAKRPILTIGKNEKLLRTKSEPVKKVNKDIKQLAQDIKDTIEANPAIGLAAVQIGVLKRVFGARMGYTDDQADEDMQPPMIFINPEILEVSQETERGHDGCMSIPNLQGFTERAVRVRMRYLDENGQKHEREFTNWDARVVLHEYDHVEGVLFTDLLKSLDDLFVLTTDENGKTKRTPYTEVMKQAQAITDK